MFSVLSDGSSERNSGEQPFEDPRKFGAVEGYPNYEVCDNGAVLAKPPGKVVVLPVVFDEGVRLRPLKREYGWSIRCEIPPPLQVGRGAHEPRQTEE